MIEASEAQALLESKFQGVRKDGLAVIARSVAMISSTKEDAEKLIANLSEEAVVNEIKAYRSSVDSEITKATSSHEAKLKEKYSFVEKVKEEGNKQTPPTPPTQTPTPQGMTLEDIRAIIAEANKPLLEKIAGYEAKSINDARREKLNSILGGDIPDFVKNAIVGQFESKQFASEEEFNTYLASQTTEVNNYRTQMQGSRMHGFRPRMQNDPSGSVDAGVEAYLKEREATQTQSEGKKLI